MRRPIQHKNIKAFGIATLIILLLGIFIGSVLFRPILSNYISQQVELKTEESNKSQEENSSEKTYLQVADQAVVLVLGINLIVATRFLFEVSFTTLKNTYKTFQCCPTLLKYYISIFSHFIVVNAP